MMTNKQTLLRVSFPLLTAMTLAFTAHAQSEGVLMTEGKGIIKKGFVDSPSYRESAQPAGETAQDPESSYKASPSKRVDPMPTTIKSAVKEEGPRERVVPEPYVGTDIEDKEKCKGPKCPKDPGKPKGPKGTPMPILPDHLPDCTKNKTC